MTIKFFTMWLTVMTVPALFCWNQTASASETGESESASSPKVTVPQPGPWRLAVVPQEAAVGVPRQILVSNGCDTNYTLDESDVATGVLRLRAGRCSSNSPKITSINYVPPAVGSMRVVFEDFQFVRAEKPLTTIAGVAGIPLRNLDGMWFDPLTIGSGVTFHQSPATKAVFGTWFMHEFKLSFGTVSAFLPSTYVRVPSGSAWLTIQNFNWAAGGEHASAVGYQVVPAVPSAFCGGGIVCPQRASTLEPYVIIQLTVFTADNALIEAFDLSGKRVMLSNLQLLKF